MQPFIHIITRLLKINQKHKPESITHMVAHKQGSQVHKDHRLLQECESFFSPSQLASYTSNISFNPFLPPPFVIDHP
jgi:hypothetical protein